MANRPVVIVPHTHWDREWYAGFQTFRMRLVELLDELLPLLEADAGYAHFMLDGQMAVIDDYLAIRPEQADRLRRLAVSGRLGMGPWYILMDEFLVSGETIIRDLQLGLERAGAFGGASAVGYLPDMFGHIAQMPQLLRQFGFEHAVVWRGVPAAVDRTAFWWSAPDGSTVRAEYLPEGYGNGASLPADAKDLIGLVERFEHRHADALVGPILWMNGTDHLLPQRWLGTVVTEANAMQDEYDFRVDSLANYVATAPTEGLSTWTGELRSGARANLLMGVASNRVDVKQAAAAAERQIERYAEPLSALFLPPARWPDAFLAAAWLEVIRNAAHDSSCACSIDEVCDAVLVRYHDARQIGEGLTRRAVEAAAAGLAAPGPVALNATARTRGGVIEIDVPGDEPVEGTQLLDRRGGDHVTEGITRADAVTLLRAALDTMPDLHQAEVQIGADDLLDIRLAHDTAGRHPRYDGPVAAQVHEAAVARPDGPARLTVTTPPTQQVLAYVADVPGFGWAQWQPGPMPVDAVTVIGSPAPDQDPTHEPVPQEQARARVHGTGSQEGAVTITNGHVTVVVDPSDGTFSLDGHPGFGRLVDDGDTGDTYNYNPPAADRIIDAPEAVAIRVLERGPVRARVAVDRRYRWPAAAEGDARVGERVVDTTTIIEVIANSPLVRLTTELDNQSRDHRLRAWFPLLSPASSSWAECAFAVVERSTEAEGGPTEKPLATFPSRRFVGSGGILVVHDGLLEYELVPGVNDNDNDNDNGALALTLLRCTGLLSQGPMTNRPLPAGPIIPTPDAQMPGPQKLRYAVQLGDVARDPMAAYAAADDAFVPLLVGHAPGGGSEPDRGQALEVAGAEVSAVRREAGQLMVRVFNPSANPSTVSITGRRGWLTDLRGRASAPFEETFALAPGQLATARLSEADRAAD